MFVLISKIFSILLAAIVISKSYVDVRARRESLQMFVVWIFTWLGIVVISLFPSIIPRMIQTLGGQAGLGTFFGMALVFLFFLLYRIWTRLERIEQRLSAVVEQLALGEYRKSVSSKR
jgi:small membrane protein